MKARSLFICSLFCRSGPVSALLCLSTECLFFLAAESVGALKDRGDRGGAVVFRQTAGDDHPAGFPVSAADLLQLVRKLVCMLIVMPLGDGRKLVAGYAEHRAVLEDVADNGAGIPDQLIPRLVRCA